MSIEERMDEFKKVANQVKENDRYIKEKESQLPYGLKRYVICPYCDEGMEICEVRESRGIYICTHCHQTLQVASK